MEVHVAADNRSGWVLGGRRAPSPLFHQKKQQQPQASLGFGGVVTPPSLLTRLAPSPPQPHPTPNKFEVWEGGREGGRRGAVTLPPSYPNLPNLLKVWGEGGSNPSSPLLSLSSLGVWVCPPLPLSPSSTHSPFPAVFFFFLLVCLVFFLRGWRRVVFGRRREDGLPPAPPPYHRRHPLEVTQLSTTVACICQPPSEQTRAATFFSCAKSVELVNFFSLIAFRSGFFEW